MKMDRKTQFRFIVLFTGNILLCSVIFLTTSCKTTQGYIESNYDTNLYYLDYDYFKYQPYQHQQYKDYGIDRDFIIEINEPVSELNELLSSSMVSFTMANMPIDVADILKAYKPDDTEYENYFDYVAKNVDRIILLPSAKGVMGFVISFNYKDVWPYESESTLYMGSKQIRLYLRKNRARGAAVAIVHEAAHKEISRLIEEKNLSYQYYAPSRTERYALIKEIEFRQKMNWESQITWDRLNDLNRYFGLPKNNVEPFVFED